MAREEYISSVDSTNIIENTSTTKRVITLVKPADTVVSQRVSELLDSYRSSDRSFGLFPRFDMVVGSSRKIIAMIGVWTRDSLCLNPQ